MASNSSNPAFTDPTLRVLRSAHLQRMARFALIDDIPSPWVAMDGTARRDAGRTENE